MAKCSKLGEIIPKTMEQRFKSLSLFEFQERFSNAADCLKYLADEKWGNGFVCRKCGHTHSCAGKATQSRQCITLNTVSQSQVRSAQGVLHCHFVSTNKKGITSTELGTCAKKPVGALKIDRTIMANFILQGSSHCLLNIRTFKVVVTGHICFYPILINLLYLVHGRNQTDRCRFY
jgi:hypothetical protein